MEITLMIQSLFGSLGRSSTADHCFIDNPAEFDRCLLEAITWITRHSAP